MRINSALYGVKLSVQGLVFPEPKFEHTRYVRDSDFKTRIEASKGYVANLSEANREYLFYKPFDFTPGNATYYSLMYNLLNILQAMKIKPGGKVLEVGSGPGWVTEILISQGFQVDAVEPSDDFIEIARERIQAHISHHHLKFQGGVKFHCDTIEECKLPADSFDAILFFDALHHVVDEKKCLKNCFQCLNSGGVLGIHEGSWSQENKDLERQLNEEMNRSGCLESPFTTDYLDYILKKTGFIQITRYHQINGLYPISQGNLTIDQAAQIRAEYANIVIAIKPSTT